MMSKRKDVTVSVFDVTGPQKKGVKLIDAVFVSHILF